MTSIPIGSRRGFIAGLGMASVGGLARATEESKPGVSPSSVAAEQPTRTDYLLPAGTIHLNTASLGATPRVVLDRTLQAWRDLESSPVLMAYGRGANTVLSAAEQ